MSPPPLSPEQRATAQAQLEEARARFPAPVAAPTRLRREALVTHPAVFQMREELDDTLVRNMVTYLRETREPFREPLRVTWAPSGDGAERWGIVDGHHRLEAYCKADWRKPIPVQAVDGGLEEACAEALRSNKDNKATLTGRERSDAAWRLVCEALSGRRKLTQREVSTATGVGLRSVKTMWSAYKDLAQREHNPGDFHWQRVRMLDIAGGSTTDAERFEKKTNALERALRKEGFERKHLPLLELVEALRQIDPAIPQKLSNLLSEARLLHDGWGPLSDPDALPFSNDDEDTDF